MTEEVIQEQADITKDTMQEQVNRIKSDVVYIIKAKDEIDAILKNLQTVQSLTQEAKGSIKSDISTISQSKSKYEQLEKEAQLKAESLNNEQGALQLEINELTLKKEALRSVIKELTKIKDDSEKSKTSTLENVRIISEAKLLYESLKLDADQKSKDLKDAHAALHEVIANFSTKYADLEICYKNYLVDEKDDGGNIIRKSKQTEINDFHDNMKQQYKTASDTIEKTKTELATFKENLEKEFKVLRVTLEGEVRSLLPDAGAAGLASAYCEAKGYYGPVLDLEGKGKIAKILCYINEHIKPTFNYMLFIGPLIGIFAILLLGIGTNIFEGLKVDEVTFQERILYRVLLSLPLFGVSIFGLMSIRLNRRLYEEYNHKQRVMQLYHSFKGEVGDTQSNKEDLIKIMLAVVKDKPSLAMKTYEKGFDTFLGSIFRKPIKDSE